MVAKTPANKEQEVLRLKAKGYGSRTIARLCGICRNTVKRILKDNVADSADE